MNRAIELKIYPCLKKWTLLAPLVIGLCCAGARADTWDSLLTEANAANKSGDHVMAMDLGLRALESARQDFGESDSSIALIYHRLGVFSHVEPYDSAIYYYDKAMAVWKGLDPPCPLSEAKTLNNLGSAFMNLGQLQQASEYLTRALQLKEPLLGKNNSSLAKAYHNLAELNGELGNYVEAEELAMGALEIRNRILPPDHPDIASTENILGNIAQKRGQWERAEYWYKHAIGTGKKRHGEAPAGYANNLAVVWIEEGKYAQAESLFVELLSDTTARDQIVGLTRSLAWNNLGLAHQLDGYHETAIPEFDSALAITKRLFGEEHLEYARQLRNKGHSLTRINRFSEAETLLLQSLAIRQELLPELHVDICNGLRGLGWLYWSTGNRAKAFDYFHREFSIYVKVVNRFIPFMTQHDALAFSTNLQAAAARCLSLLSNWNDVDSIWRDSVRTSIVYQTKGIVSEELATRRFYLATENNPSDKKLLDELASVQSQMFLLLTSSPDWTPEDVAYLDSLELRAQRLEETAVASLRDYRPAAHESIRVDDVANSLPARSTLLEYYTYVDIDSSGGNTTDRYLVVVVNTDESYHVSDLGPSAGANTLISRFRDHFDEIDSVGVLPGKKQLAVYDSIATGLYDYYVAPLEPYLGNQERTFVALDGRAHLFSLNCLKDRRGSYLIERWPIHYLSCGRDLIDETTPTAPGKGMLAIGDPDFSLGDLPGGAMSNGRPDSKVEMYTSSRGFARSGNDIHLQPVPASQKEIALVSAAWRSVTREPVKLLIGADATEEHFRTDAVGKHVIYIATHGFFEEDSLAACLPYLHCGLYLAGANHYDDSTSYSPMNDGIITAQDILMMDLQGVYLVVLSACESGLGEITDGEGVFGLRRAFQIAGARAVVSSLWRIPDEFTSRMMSPLFEESDSDLMTRIRDLELKQLARMRKEGLPDHPYTWAAFISTGAWH